VKIILQGLRWKKNQRTYHSYTTTAWRLSTLSGLLIIDEKLARKWRKWNFGTGSLRGQVRVRPIDKLDEACTNADDRMMLVQYRSGHRLLS
jgi:hypothetical protein